LQRGPGSTEPVEQGLEQIGSHDLPLTPPPPRGDVATATRALDRLRVNVEKNRDLGDGVAVARGEGPDVLLGHRLDGIRPHSGRSTFHGPIPTPARSRDLPRFPLRTSEQDVTHGI
jgi:hypothetical protein